MRKLTRSALSASLLMALGHGYSAVGQNSPCTFTGPQADQAKCLLRPVRMYANLGPRLQALPHPLDTLVGQSVTLTKEQLRDYLASHSIRESEVGGPLSNPVSRTSGGEHARYFIIHDTSSPVYAAGQDFPANIDDDSWAGNNLGGHVNSRKAHIFINRAGKSATSVDFATPWRSTKYEMQSLSRKGLFLGVELIQPRRRDARGIDAYAPTPGFTNAQLDRLALVYVAASVRRGQWLIPAFHAAIDAGISSNSHDDPQNFDLNRWATRLNDLLEALGQSPPGGSGTGTTSSATVPVSNSALDLVFDFPEPAGLGQRKMIWATHYYVYGDVRPVPDGKPLLSMSGVSLGPLISERDWCLGAIEGTIRVVDENGQAKVYNFAGRGNTVQVDCSRVIRNPSINLRAIGSSRYSLSRGPFGDGVQGKVLVPYRSIAVDRNFIPFGSTIYIPAARGKQITLPSGQTATHDGYFYAADTGGAIRGNHVDVFGGVFRDNPFPSFIRSNSSQTFEAFLITDPQITETLKRLHTAPSP